MNEAILLDRALHRQRVGATRATAAVLEEVERHQLGRRKGWHDQKLTESRRAMVGSRLGCAAVKIGKVNSASNLELSCESLNGGGLPEVMLFGHSNCGKSALLNALTGSRVRSKGPAEVHARAGWTAELGYYRVEVKRLPREWKQAVGRSRDADEDEEDSGDALADMLSKRGGGMVLVDTPGYGFTVSSEPERRQWTELFEGYIERAPHLRIAAFLVDSERGVCLEDRKVLRQVQAAGLPILPVLTKTDLLRPDDLACSHAVISAQLANVTSQHVNLTSQHVPPMAHAAMLSSHFYHGIQHFWDRILLELLRAPRRPPAGERGCPPVGGLQPPAAPAAAAQLGQPQAQPQGQPVTQAGGGASSDGRTRRRVRRRVLVADGDA